LHFVNVTKLVYKDRGQALFTPRVALCVKYLSEYIVSFFDVLL